MATTTKSKVTKIEPPVNTEPKALQEKAPASVAEPTSTKTYKVRKQLDPNMIVSVKNGFPGPLVYISSRTGERFRWEELGDEQDMELQELKNARNSSKAFFANNWFMLDDPEVIEYLGVAEYYKRAFNLGNEAILQAMSPSEIKAAVAAMPNGRQLALKYRVKQMIEDGTLDSIKSITAFEDALGVELIER